MDNSEALELPPPGTPSFFSTLLVKASRSGTPVDPVILQAILVCLISGKKHLILRTPDDDVGNVLKLTNLIFSAIFGYTTHKLKIRSQARDTKPTSSAFPSTNPNAFLRTLFLRSAPTRYPDGIVARPAGSMRVSHHTKSTLSFKGHEYHRTQESSISSDGNTVPSGLHDVKPLQQRLVPNSSVADASDPFATIKSNPFVTGDHVHSPSESNISPEHASLVSRFRKNTDKHADFPLRPHQTHANTDPTPRSQRGLGDGTILELPQALIMSGLENASISSQRALIDVLNQQRVVLHGEINESHGVSTNRRRTRKMSYDVADAASTHAMAEDGVWNLPDGFMLVYICPSSNSQRPSIHKTLLDKFSMSANVVLQLNTRMALRSLSSSQIYSPSSPPPSAHRNLGLNPTSHSYFPSHLTGSRSGASVVGDSPTIPPSLLATLRDYYNAVSMSSTLSLYMSDLFSAARHHPQLDGTLLTLRSMQDARDLARAARVLGADATGAEFIQELVKLNEYGVNSEDTRRSREPSQVGDFHEYEDLFQDMGNAAETVRINLLPPSAASLVPSQETRVPREDQVKERNSVKQATTFPDELDATSSLYSRWDPDRGEEVKGQVLDVSQADIARIVPRVMSHRLRLRDGPEDEIFGSALYSAVGSLDRAHSEQPERMSSVKDVLIDILAKV